MPISIKSGFAFAPRGSTSGPIPIQSKTLQNGSASTNTMNMTLTSPVGSGHMLVVTIGCVAISGDTATFTDDKGNTYTNTLGFVVNTPGSYGVATAYIPNVTNGPQTITVTLNNSRTFLTLIADEWANASTLDVAGAGQAQTNPGTGANAVTSTNVTTSSNGDLIYGIGISINSVGFSNGSGFTALQAVSSTFYTEYLVQSSAGSIAVTFTSATGTDQTLACIFPFKSP